MRHVAHQCLCVEVEDGFPHGSCHREFSDWPWSGGARELCTVLPPASIPARPRDYPLAGYPPLPPVEADDDYDLPAGGRSHTGAAGPGQVDPVAPGLMRDDPRTIAALPPEPKPARGRNCRRSSVAPWS